jgi:hypothetical protein
MAGGEASFKGDVSRGECGGGGDSSIGSEVPESSPLVEETAAAAKSPISRGRQKKRAGTHDG